MKLHWRYQREKPSDKASAKYNTLLPPNASWDTAKHGIVSRHCTSHSESQSLVLLLSIRFTFPALQSSQPEPLVSFLVPKGWDGQDECRSAGMWHVHRRRLTERREGSHQVRLHTRLCFLSCLLWSHWHNSVLKSFVWQVFGKGEKKGSALILNQHKTRSLWRWFLYFTDAAKHSLQNVKLVHFHEKDDASS